jgi:hypothetical protein
MGENGEKQPKKRKISVSSSKDKARRLQNWVGEKVSILIEMPFGKDQPIASREMGQSGTDIRLVGEALEKFPFSVECKYQEEWSIFAWIAQAKANRLEGTQWLLFAKKNRVSPIVVIDQQVFSNLLELCAQSEDWCSTSVCKEKWSVLKWVEESRKKHPKGVKWSYIAQRKETEPVAIIDAELFFNLLEQIENPVKGIPRCSCQST